MASLVRSSGHECHQVPPADGEVPLPTVLEKVHCSPPTYQDGSASRGRNGGGVPTQPLTGRCGSDDRAAAKNKPPGRVPCFPTLDSVCFVFGVWNAPMFARAISFGRKLNSKPEKPG
jgi:hypothetical protein